MVMTGMRVQVGTQAIERAPSYVEVFGRTMQINLTRARWFDFPFTREEALQADKKLSIFSKSSDESVAIILSRLLLISGHFFISGNSKFWCKDVTMKHTRLNFNILCNT